MGSTRSLRISSRSLRNSSKKLRCKNYWCAEIDPKSDCFIISLLLLQTISTGLQDAVVFMSYRCLHSAQTGNTVLLAIAIAQNVSGYNPVLANAATSLIAFCIGSLLTGQGHNLFGERVRWWQILLGFAQSAMVIGATAVQEIHGVKETGLWACVPIGLLAGSIGSQIAGARAWDIPEITTAMATAAWVDLARDEGFWRLDNRKRNLRVFFFIALVAGCALGAFLRNWVGPVWTLGISVMLKFPAHIFMLIAKHVDEDVDDSDSDVIPL